MPANFTYSRTAPDQLWYNAREEILFGGGKFTIAVVDPAIASRITKRWVSHFLSHPQGMAFIAEQQGGKVIISLSPIGLQAIARAGYDLSELEFLGMNTATKADFLERFEEALKEIS